jgi:deazaflavin-dependent oxidoreductase (nitroreductase family)
MNQIIEIKKETALHEPTTRKFPAEGTHLARILSDPKHRQAFHAQLKRYNPWVVILYKSGLLPLFGMSRTVMLLTTRGRKSGKLRSTPIGYFRIGGVVHLFSAWGKGASWYKNMVDSPDHVWIQIGMAKQPARTEVINQPDEIMKTLAQFIDESPDQAHYLFGWEPKLDRLDHADFSMVIDRVLIVRFIPKTG